MSRPAACAMTIPTPPARPCTNRAAISSSIVGLIAQSADVSDVRDDADEQDAAPPEPVRQRTRDQLSRGQPDQAGGDRQLRDGGRRTQLDGQGREGGEVEVHRDRTEHRQQEQQRRQQPAERRSETERSGRACHQPHGRAGSEGVPDEGCTDREPLIRMPRPTMSTWTTEPRCASSSCRGGRSSPRTRRGSPPARTGAWPACDAPRSRPSPASASSTTPSSSAAPSPAPPPPCSTRSRGRCSSTTPSARTCSTSPAPPTASPPPVVPGAAPRRQPHHAPACCGPCRRSPTASRSCATSTRTCSPPTSWDARSTHH